jgi:hypothetical protein
MVAIKKQMAIRNESRRDCLTGLCAPSTMAGRVKCREIRAARAGRYAKGIVRVPWDPHSSRTRSAWRISLPRPRPDKGAVHKGAMQKRSQ